MRQAGLLPDQKTAARFADYLFTLGITSKVEPAGDAWAVWVREEGHLERSKHELAEFQANPQDSRYAEVAAAADASRRAEAQQNKRQQQKQVAMRERWNAAASRQTFVTTTLILASVGITLLTRFGDDKGPILQSLYISSAAQPTRTPGGELRWPLGQLVEIRQGEVWRLVTPIFLHFRIGGVPFLHLFFNMYWLYVLGGMLEIRCGSGRLLWLVLALAVASNLGQYLTDGPRFGGMSGVAYGLFGFVWMKSRFDPASGIYIDPGTVFLMMASFVLCYLGTFGNVANTAHGVGLGVGMALGYAPTLVKR